MDRKRSKKDDDVFRHQISCTDDQKTWVLAIDCDLPISPAEFGAACISLGKDIVKGKIVFDDAIDTEKSEDFN